MVSKKVETKKPNKREVKATDKAKAKKTKESKSVPKGKFFSLHFPLYLSLLTDEILKSSTSCLYHFFAS
jgi:hypothetical protein